MENMKKDDFIYNLITSVQMNPCLYDKSHNFYFNIQKKQKAWEGIAKTTNSTIQECKFKWKGLREKYSRELKKEQMPSGASDGSEWEFMEEMEFLRSSMTQKRKIKSQICTDSEDEISQNGCEEIFTEPPAKKKSFEALCETFGNVCKKFEQQLATTSFETNDPDGDDAFLASMLPLMRSLPIDAKDNFKAEMILRLTELRCLHRNNN